MADNETDAIGLGAELQAARQDKKLQLEDIAAQLRIREDHLQALEEEDFDRLPGDVYAIGFIRTYANFLGLNATELISRFKAVRQEALLADVPVPSESEGEPISMALKIGLGVAGVFVFYLMWLVAGEPDRPPQRADIEAEAPAPEAASEAPVARPQSKPDAAPDPKPAAQPAPQPATKPALAVAPSAAPADTEIAAAPAPVPPARSEAEVRQNLPVTDKLSRDPDVEVREMASLDAAPQSLAIRATSRTWMRLENAAGKVLFSSIINEGRSFEIDTTGEYVLATRDAGALEFVIDGEAAGTIGRRGQILTSRRFSRDAILRRQP